MRVVLQLLEGLGLLIVTMLLIGAVGFPFQTNPIGPLAGQRLTGIEATWPEDWSFSDEYSFAAIEVRPDDLHSVTTLCFVVDGMLHVPAAGAAENEWPALVAGVRGCA